MPCHSSHAKGVPSVVSLNIPYDRFRMRHFLFDETPFRNDLLFVDVRPGQFPLRFDDVEDGLRMVQSTRRPFELHRPSTLTFHRCDVVRLRNFAYDERRTG